MPLILGLDTSNYTTSAALFDTDQNTLKCEKRLLPVKSGECGLRQSDAVFHHTRQLPEIINRLFNGIDKTVDIVCASEAPRGCDGSYMPCFLVGSGSALSISSACGAEYIGTNHQLGHIFAACYSAGRFDLITRHKQFIAFHISGGTTDCMLISFKGCEPEVTLLASSKDLKAGQAVDRVGVMLGLDFPCGLALEDLAMKSKRLFNTKVKLIGADCSLSGIENKCKDMLNRNEPREDIAAFCLDYIYKVVFEMTSYQIRSLGKLPVIFAGGVMSNVMIRKRIERDFDNAHFAQREFSCDNAYGVCLYAAYKKGLM